jgi:hypothetical protein
VAFVNVWYDQEGNYLEVLFEDTPAALEEVSDDVFERRTPEGRVVGFVVFSVRWFGIGRGRDWQAIPALSASLLR